MPVMRREADNLLDSTGREWFRRRVVGAYMLHENKVLRLCDVYNDNNLQFEDMDGQPILLPKTVLKGFGNLAYPQLGYRKIQDSVYYVSRKPNWQRGLRRDSLKAEYSPAGRALRENFEDFVHRPNTEKLLMQAVFVPKYDAPQALDLLKRGETTGVVLNHDVMVEPSVFEEDDDYIVYFRDRPCGRMDNDSNFKWYSPEYKAAVAPMMAGYGVHA